MLKTRGCVAGMQADLQKLLQLGEDFTTDRRSINTLTVDVLKFWRDHGPELDPAWSIAARVAFSLTPSSAASERVFSLLKSMFGENQLRSLGDQIESGLMLRYNKRL